MILIITLGVRQGKLALLISFLPQREVYLWGLSSQIRGDPGDQSIWVVLEEKFTLAFNAAAPLPCPRLSPPPLSLLPSPCPRMSHIQIIDKGFVGTLVHGAGLGELDHVQILGFPELRELVLCPKLLPKGLMPPEGHPEDKAPCEEEMHFCLSLNRPSPTPFSRG